MLLVEAGHRLGEEYVSTCHGRTCSCFSHDSGYVAVKATPEPVEIETGGLPRAVGGRWSGGYDDGLWRLADGRVAAVRKWRGSPSSHGSVDLLYGAVGPAPAGPVDEDVAAVVRYQRGEAAHADSHLYDGSWHCGTSECGRLPALVAWSVALYAAAAADGNGASLYRDAVEAAAAAVLAPEREAQDRTGGLPPVCGDWTLGW